MHPGRAYKRAGEKEQAGFDQANQIRQPFIQNGITAGQGQMDYYNKLMHPEQLQDEWAKNYSQSEHAKNLIAQNQTNGLDAAAAMGQVGSSAALANIQKGAGDIASKDQQQYYDNLMQKINLGSNIGQNMYNQGSGQASQGASDAQQHGQWQAQNQYNKDTAGRDQFAQIMPFIIKMMEEYGLGGLPGGGMSSDMYGGS